MTIKPRARRALTATGTPSVAARVPRPRIPSPPEVRSAHVHGSYIDTVSVIPRTIASLHLAPGRLGDAEDEERIKVLMPFAEVRLGGDALKVISDAGEVDEETLPTLFTANLPLENLVYVLLDLTSDVKRICQEVCALGDGDLVVDPARMAHVRYYLAHLERQARLARVRLDQRYGVPAEDA